MDKARSNYFLNFPGYTTYDKTRNNHGGGVAIIIKSSIDHAQIHDFDSLNLELISLKINRKKGDLIVLTYYNPTNKTLFSDLFERLAAADIPFLLGGDLNASSKLIGGSYDHPVNGAILEEILNNLDILFYSFSIFMIFYPSFLFFRLKRLAYNGLLFN